MTGLALGVQHMREVPRKESKVVAIFVRGGQAFNDFVRTNPPADLDMATQGILLCVFLREHNGEAYIKQVAGVADLALDLHEFKVLRYVKEEMSWMPQRDDASYESLVDWLGEFNELVSVIPLPLEEHLDALHRAVCREEDLRTELMQLGVDPGPKTPRVDSSLLGNEDQRINDVWAYSMLLTRNIRSLKDRIQQTQNTHRSSKLLHIAKNLYEF